MLLMREKGQLFLFQRVGWLYDSMIWLFFPKFCMKKNGLFRLSLWPIVKGILNGLLSSK